MPSRADSGRPAYRCSRHGAMRSKRLESGARGAMNGSGADAAARLESDGSGAVIDKSASAVRDRVTPCQPSGHQTSSSKVKGVLDASGLSAPWDRDSLARRQTYRTCAPARRCGANRSAAADRRGRGRCGAAPADGGGSRPPQEGFRSVAANWQQETRNLCSSMAFRHGSLLQDRWWERYAAESPECLDTLPAVPRRAVKT